MLLVNKNSKKAFTMAEVLIAAAIFSLFSLGVFSLFRTGNKMYLSGSWKFNKQKEAEYFLNIVKERIEQASKPSYILGSESAGYSLNEIDSPFLVRNNKAEIKLTNLTGKLYIAEFVIGKMDKSKMPAPNNNRGLIYYNSLFCEPQGGGLAKLCLYTDSNRNAANLKAVAAPNTFPPVIPVGPNFTEPHTTFSLPKAPQLLTLPDVSSVQINGGVFNATSTANPYFGLTVKMQCPNHKETTLTLNLNAKVDSSLKFAYVGL